MKRDVALLGARFRVDRFELPAAGGSVTRELVVHPGAVVVLPVLDDGRVVLLENHRPMLGVTLLELPAGTLEPGELPEPAARRELREESGFVARTLEPLFVAYASPGITDERFFAFRASGLENVGQDLDPTERIDVRVCTLEDALAAASEESRSDVKTLALLLGEARRRARGPC